jgi:hypothetical protein
VWLASDEDRRLHLCGLAGISREEAERLTPREGICKDSRTVRNRMPMGVDLSGRWVFVYVVTGDQRDDFEWFLQGRSGMLATVPGWTLQVVVPPNLGWLGERYRDEARSEFDSPLRPDLVKHLRWYFKQRQAHSLEGASIKDEESYDEAQYAFGATRFQVLYRRWLKEGEAAFEGISSAAIVEAIERGVGRVECLILPFSYRHLSPLVASTRSRSKGAEEGEDKPAPSRPPVMLSILSGQTPAEHAGHTTP